MAIKLSFTKTEEDLTGKSKWWGSPDLPDDLDYPINFFKAENEGEEDWDEPLTFVCQIRCEDLAAVDPEGKLPHKGMLYFFAALEEYIDDGEPCSVHNGLGEWDTDAYKVLYTEQTEDLNPYEIRYEDDTPYNKPAEKISFKRTGDNDSFAMLCPPFYEEVAELYPNWVSLLQIDESEQWGLRLYDCGMINFMIRRTDLKVRNWDEVSVYFHSF